MADAVFKWCHFAPDLILVCVRWYCRYGISYRDLEKMMAERGVSSTIRRPAAGCSATPLNSRSGRSGRGRRPISAKTYGKKREHG